MLDDTIGIAATSVHCNDEGVCLVGSDESIWGWGKVCQGYDEGDDKLRKIEPEPGSSELKNIMKVAHGKSCRLVLTKDNRLWFSGLSQCEMLGYQNDQ